MSIHDLVMVKEEGLADRLHYDDHERRLGLVRFLAPGATPEQVADGIEAELGDLVDGEWQVDHLAPGQVSLSRSGWAHGQPLTVSKTIRLLGGRLDPQLVVELEVHHRGDEPRRDAAGPRAAAPPPRRAAAIRPRGTTSAATGPATTRRGEASGVETIGYGNDWVGIAVEARPEPAADAWWSPIETVSNSEAGFERVYQGSALLVSWPRHPGTRRVAPRRRDPTGQCHPRSGRRRGGTAVTRERPAWEDAVPG